MSKHHDAFRIGRYMQDATQVPLAARDLDFSLLLICLGKHGVPSFIKSWKTMQIIADSQGIEPSWTDKRASLMPGVEQPGLIVSKALP
jgi:hypothetical protein